MKVFLLDASFIPKFDFWVFLTIGVLGLFLSGISAYQANKAKIAAQQAGKIVKIQDVLLEISGILNICQLNFSDDYPKTSVRVNEISGKIKCNKRQFT